MNESGPPPVPESSGPPRFDPGFSTAEMAAVFTASEHVGDMLRVEAALAEAEARHGIIPVDAARAIVEACASAPIEPDRIIAEGWERGTPVLPLLDQLRTQLSGEHAGWLHFGATTQDIVDTASMLRYRSAIALLVQAIRPVEAGLRRLGHEHRRTPILGRTMLQPGAPTSFGLVATVWSNAMRRPQARLEAAEAGLPLQLGGPVGDLRSLGPSAVEVVDELAAALGLAHPLLPWHTDRYPVYDMASAIAAVLKGVAKIASDMVLLAEQGELHMRSTGSSSMPAKRNPFDAVHALAATRAGLAAASAVITGPPHELQRAAGAWHAEWWAVPMVCHTTAAAVEALARAVETLEVDEVVMVANIRAAGLQPSVPDSAEALIERALGHEKEWK